MCKIFRFLICFIIFQSTVFGLPTTNLQLVTGTFALNSTTRNSFMLLRDNDSKWRFSQTLEPNSTLSHQVDLADVSCTQLSCFTVGAFLAHNDEELVPAILASQDRGETWSKIEIENLPANIQRYLHSITCTQSYCVAYGTDGYNKSLLITSHDEGRTWKIITISATTAAGLARVRCKKNICLLAVGPTEKDPIRFLVTHDNANTWSYSQTVTNLPVADKYRIYSYEFVDDKILAVGESVTFKYDDHHELILFTKPLIIISKDKGITWSAVKNPSSFPTSLPDPGLTSVSCNRSKCVAVGAYRPDIERGLWHPLIFVSFDQGKSWFFITNVSGKDINEYHGILHQVKCDNRICHAVGGYDPDQKGWKPLIINSDPEMSYWWFVNNNIRLTQNFSSGGLTKINCENNICIAIGGFTDNQNNDQLLLLTSTDSGYKWASQEFKFPDKAYWYNASSIAIN